MTKHFGVEIISRKHGLRLTRENYAEISNKNSLSKFDYDFYLDDEGKFYTEKWCKQQYIDVMTNFDLNMEYFSQLNHVQLEFEIVEFLRRNKDFKEVTNLSLLDGETGYYLMVLDDYCHVYIGISTNIFQRIKNHWNVRKPFDRLLLPMGNVDGSTLSIDSFRALDTTRLYAFITDNIYDSEDDYINQFSPEFCSNRVGGGVISLPEAIATLKTRKLK